MLSSVVLFFLTRGSIGKFLLENARPRPTEKSRGRKRKPGLGGGGERHFKNVCTEPLNGMALSIRKRRLGRTWPVRRNLSTGFIISWQKARQLEQGNRFNSGPGPGDLSGSYQPLFHLEIWKWVSSLEKTCLIVLPFFFNIISVEGFREECTPRKRCRSRAAMNGPTRFRPRPRSRGMGRHRSVRSTNPRTVMRNTNL